MHPGPDRPPPMGEAAPAGASAVSNSAPSTPRLWDISPFPASASGGFVPALAGKNRTIITATKTDGERNQTRFGEYFAAAFAGNAADADTDKDGRVSVLEAFLWARARTADSYSRDGQLLTEHAVLDDDGDGKIEGVETEVAGLKDALAKVLIAWKDSAGKSVTFKDGEFTTTDVALSVDIKGALYNYSFVNVAGPVHNLYRSVGLLQLAIEKVSGKPLEKATLLYTK